MRVGFFGSIMVAELGLVLGKGTQIRANLMEQLLNADLCVVKRVVEEKTKEISILSNLEQKVGLVAFTLGMRSTQLSESLNSDLKHRLKSDLDVIRFFKHFERVVQGKRDIELSLEYESRELVPRVKMRTPMLVQASQVYTPIVQHQNNNSRGSGLRSFTDLFTVCSMCKSVEKVLLK
ncbi:hypothetical protein ACQJBY_053800 [Aegilops geniculata]